MRREEVIDKAFTIATRIINPVMMEPEVVKQTLKTNMRAYCDGTYFRIKDSEIDRRINQWMDTVSRAGKDHSYMDNNDWQ